MRRRPGPTAVSSSSSWRHVVVTRCIRQGLSPFLLLFSLFGLFVEPLIYLLLEVHRAYCTYISGKRCFGTQKKVAFPISTVFFLLLLFLLHFFFVHRIHLHRRERERDMASSGGDAGGSDDGDKAPEKAAASLEEKKKRDKTKDVATAILERKKAPNRLVVGASSFFFHRLPFVSSRIVIGISKSIIIDRAFLLLNRVVQTSRGVARPSSRHRRQRESLLLLCVSL